MPKAMKKPKITSKKILKNKKQKLSVKKTTYRKNGDNNRLADLKEQIKRQCRTMGEGIHSIGLCLRLVRDDKLWRVDRAKSFGDWIVQHTDMSRMTAYNMIAVATHLTHKQAGQFGPTLSYSIAKATDKAAAKELQKLASSGASTAETEHERLRQLREQNQQSLPANKRARGPRAVKRAVSVHGSNGDDMVEVKTVGKTKPPKTRKTSFAKNEAGIHEIKPIVMTKLDKCFTKAGWNLAVPKMQIGQNGPTIKLWVNIKEMRVRYRIL